MKNRYDQDDLTCAECKFSRVLRVDPVRPQRHRRAVLPRQRVLAEYDWRVIAPKSDALYRDHVLQP